MNIRSNKSLLMRKRTNLDPNKIDANFFKGCSNQPLVLADRLMTLNLYLSDLKEPNSNEIKDLKTILAQLTSKDILTQSDSNIQLKLVLSCAFVDLMRILNETESFFLHNKIAPMIRTISHVMRRAPSFSEEAQQQQINFLVSQFEKIDVASIFAKEKDPTIRVDLFKGLYSLAAFQYENSPLIQQIQKIASRVIPSSSDECSETALEGFFDYLLRNLQKKVVKHGAFVLSKYLLRALSWPVKTVLNRYLSELFHRKKFLPEGISFEGFIGVFKYLYKTDPELVNNLIPAIEDDLLQTAKRELKKSYIVLIGNLCSCKNSEFSLKFNHLFKLFCEAVTSKKSALFRNELIHLAFKYLRNYGISRLIRHRRSSILSFDSNDFKKNANLIVQKLREALTDSESACKIEILQRIASNMKEDHCFYSVDELKEVALLLTTQDNDIREAAQTALAEIYQVYCCPLYEKLYFDLDDNKDNFEVKDGKVSDHHLERKETARKFLWIADCICCSVFALPKVNSIQLLKAFMSLFSTSEQDAQSQARCFYGLFYNLTKSQAKNEKFYDRNTINYRDFVNKFLKYKWIQEFHCDGDDPKLKEEAIRQLFKRYNRGLFNMLNLADGKEAAVDHSKLKKLGWGETFDEIKAKISTDTSLQASASSTRRENENPLKIAKQQESEKIIPEVLSAQSQQTIRLYNSEFLTFSFLAEIQEICLSHLDAFPKDSICKLEVSLNLLYLFYRTGSLRKLTTSMIESLDKFMSKLLVEIQTDDTAQKIIIERLLGVSLKIILGFSAKNKENSIFTNEALKDKLAFHLLKSSFSPKISADAFSLVWQIDRYTSTEVTPKLAKHFSEGVHPKSVFLLTNLKSLQRILTVLPKLYSENQKLFLDLMNRMFGTKDQVSSYNVISELTRVKKTLLKINCRQVMKCKNSLSSFATLNTFLTRLLFEYSDYFVEIGQADLNYLRMYALKYYFQICFCRPNEISKEELLLKTSILMLDSCEDLRKCLLSLIFNRKSSSEISERNHVLLTLLFLHVLEPTESLQTIQHKALLKFLSLGAQKYYQESNQSSGLNEGTFSLADHPENALYYLIYLIFNNYALRADGSENENSSRACKILEGYVDIMKKAGWQADIGERMLTILENLKTLEFKVDTEIFRLSATTKNSVYSQKSQDTQQFNSSSNEAFYLHLLKFTARTVYKIFELKTSPSIKQMSSAENWKSDLYQKRAVALKDTLYQPPQVQLVPKKVLRFDQSETKKPSKSTQSQFSLDSFAYDSSTAFTSKMKNSLFAPQTSSYGAGLTSNLNIVEKDYLEIPKYRSSSKTPLKDFSASKFQESSRKENNTTMTTTARSFKIKRNDNLEYPMQKRVKLTLKPKNTAGFD